MTQDDPTQTPEERKFHVKISAVATELKPGPGNSPPEEIPFANEEIEWHDMSYVDVVIIEQIWGAFHEELANLGPERIKFWLEHGNDGDEAKVKLMEQIAATTKLGKH